MCVFSTCIVGDGSVNAVNIWLHRLFIIIELVQPYIISLNGANKNTMKRFIKYRLAQRGISTGILCANRLISPVFALLIYFGNFI